MPAGLCLELFARTYNLYSDWITVGNEANSYMKPNKIIIPAIEDLRIIQVIRDIKNLTSNLFFGLHNQTRRRNKNAHHM